MHGGTIGRGHLWALLEEHWFDRVEGAVLLEFGSQCFFPSILLTALKFSYHTFPSCLVLPVRGVGKDKFHEEGNR